MQRGLESRLRSQWPAESEDSGAEEARGSWTRLAISLRRKLEQRMGQYPRATLTGAAMLGLAIGWLVKRK